MKMTLSTLNMSNENRSASPTSSPRSSPRPSPRPQNKRDHAKSDTYLTVSYKESSPTSKVDGLSSSVPTPEASLSSKSLIGELTPPEFARAESTCSSTSKDKEKIRSKKKSAWYNVLYPTYKSRSEDFRQIFKDVPDDERLVVDYSCALQKEILVQGRLYISQNYLCFYANIFGWETNVSFKWKDVTAITKEKTALVIPNAILVAAKNERFFFTSFVARDKTYLMLFRVWQNALMERPMNQQEMWQLVHDSYGAADPHTHHKAAKMATALVQQPNVNDYLLKKQKEDKDLAVEWQQLEELHNKKLWHQLTLKLLDFVKHPNLQKGDQLIQLYNNFITTFENKINPLSLVEIIAVVIEQFKDKSEAVQFLEKIAPKVKANSDAENLCKVLAGQIHLEKLNDLEATKKIIEEVEATLDNADGVTAVHGRFYHLASQYYRIQGDHAQYYRTALRYLGCIDLETLAVETRHQHAFFLGLAALLGEGVYNLGELLAHPILESLNSTENAWLVQLLYAFNSGDIGKFESMKKHWGAIADLATQELFLRQKISLLCLMEMTFKRPSHDRQLTFEEIAKETRLPINEIELLVMKALSQGLVKGAIDQVANTVNMTWVQPRVLDRKQISNMVDRLNEWCKHVSTMENLLEEKASEILTL